LATGFDAWGKIPRKFFGIYLGAFSLEPGGKNPVVKFAYVSGEGRNWIGRFAKRTEDSGGCTG